MHDRIDTLEQLESLYEAPAALSLDKVTATIHPLYRQLIEASPFFAIASAGAQGLDISPRGNPAGFVKVLDDRHIAIPDRRGNNRIDTLRNIIRDPQVALLFLVPGLEMTLRYNGRAHLSTEPQLLETLSYQGKRPVCAIVVEVQTLFFQCARALKRAKLWDPSQHCDPQSMPTAGQLAKAAVPTFDADSYDVDLQQRQQRTLY